MPNLYIIAGCNGSGKTTASFTILPEVLNCKEFVNADEIASGLSPFQPENVAIESGRIMLTRINELIEKGESFAFETTLSTKSYRQKVIVAQQAGFRVSLLFFWLICLFVFWFVGFVGYLVCWFVGMFECLHVCTCVL